MSIIVNCYNGEKYLRDAIDSILAQTYENWEVIFWDNQSTDRSAEIFQRCSDPRLRYFYAPTHTRLYDARNYAIEKASGELLAFLDVDDWWAPEKLERQIPLFDDPEVGMVCANYTVVSELENKRWIGFRGSVPTGRVLNEVLGSFFVGLLTLVIRRGALDSLGHLCDPRYDIIGDFDLIVRLSLEWKLDCVQDPIAFYRVHDSNLGRHRPLFVDECLVWISEARLNQAISASPGFELFVNKTRYAEGMNQMMRQNRLRALAIATHMAWGRLKLKLLLAVVLPRAIWTIRHERPVSIEQRV